MLRAVLLAHDFYQIRYGNLVCVRVCVRVFACVCLCMCMWALFSEIFGLVCTWFFMYLWWSSCKHVIRCRFWHALKWHGFSEWSRLMWHFSPQWTRLRQMFDLSGLIVMCQVWVRSKHLTPSSCHYWIIKMKKGPRDTVSSLRLTLGLNSLLTFQLRLVDFAKRFEDRPRCKTHALSLLSYNCKLSKCCAQALWDGNKYRSTVCIMKSLLWHLKQAWMLNGKERMHCARNRIPDSFCVENGNARCQK